MTSRRPAGSRILLAAMLLATLVPPTRATAWQPAHPVPRPAPQTRTAAAPASPATIEDAPDTPPPLPRSCGFSTPGGACCIFGYVYRGDEAVDGARVTLTNSEGARVVLTTTYAVDNPASYYSANLSAPPLSAIVGSTLTLVAQHDGLMSTRTWVVQPSSQQVDLGLLDPDMAHILRVDAGATGAGDGTTWASAFPQLQPALDLASTLAPTDTVEIWVAAGIYTPTAGVTRTATFQLIDNVALYGGFAGVESERDARDPQTNITALSGDLDGDDLTDAHGVVTDTANIVGTNAYHVVTGSGVTRTATLDGFTITAGKADGGAANYWERGGGMINVDGSPTLTNVTFQGNVGEYWGGGMYNENSHPTLTTVTFQNNAAPNPTYGGGGGMFNFSGSSPTLTDVTFYDNAATYGGGIFSNNSSPSLTDVVFWGNRVTDSGGGMYNWNDSTPSLNRVTFEGNNALNGGGGMVTYDSTFTMTHVIFRGNSTTFGGGMYNSNSHLTLVNVLFYENDATYGGGMDNHLQTNATLVNVTAYSNTASFGGGIYNDDSSATLHNTILWGNPSSTREIDNYNGSTSTSSYSLIDGCGGSGASWNSALGTDGGGNIDADPLFRDPAGGDLHLWPTSSAIDAGDNAAITATTDLDGNPRFVDVPSAPDTGAGTPPLVDMGAYERQSGAILRVAAGATGAGDGFSWSNAFPSLQSALDLASTIAPTDTVEIWVAAGVYTPTNAADRTATFQLMDNVALYGGFAGGENVRSQRDWETNVTVLSGDLDGNDLTDAHGVVTDTTGIVGNNAYHVVTGDGVTRTATLDGFTITAGKASSGWPTGHGGGMFNNGSSPTLAHLTFQGNTSENVGGGMYNGYSSNPTLNDVVFVNNYAQGGGGMYNQEYSNPTLKDTIFRGNSAETGGGMCNDYGNPTLTNVIFQDNEVSGSGSGSGGGMHNFHSDPTLVNVTFLNQTAISGGGIFNDYYSNPRLINVILQGNFAEYAGGGIYNKHNSHAVLENTILWGNTAPDSAHIYNEPTIPSTPTISYSLIEGSGGSGAGWDPALGTDGGGNIDADPLFVDSANGDLRLCLTSPAIDAGDNAAITAPTDLAGNPRFVDVPSILDTGSGTPPLVDMGAYERQPTAYAPPNAAFTLPATGAVPFSVDLIADTAGTVGAWTWDLGDGRTSGARYLDHVYTLPGTYTVTLTATGPGGQDSHTVPLDVAPPPEADFTAAPLSGVAPLTVAFTATVSADATLWDLGDGTTSTLPSLTHVYAAGTYTVSLTVTQGDDTNVQHARIVAQPAGWSSPVAHLAVQPVAGDETTVFSFDASGSSGATAARWDWDGDGAYDTVDLPITQVVTRTFPAGSPTVGLQVRDGSNQTDHLTQTLTVRSAPEWLFLLYLAGDNDLDGPLHAALNRLEAKLANPNVTLVALVDGPGQGDAWRYHVQPGGNYRTGVDRWHVGEAAMDDPQTLVDFVTWAQEHAPADHTLLAIADHGRGTTGLAWDDTSGDDQFLSAHADLDAALSAITGGGSQRLDVLFLDACLMGMLETAYEASETADYLVASENHGWGFFAYDDYAAAATTGTTPRQLATAIAATYHDHLSTRGLPGTISAVDLATIGDVVTTTDVLAQELTAYIASPAAHQQVAAIRGRVQTLDSQNYLQLDQDDAYVDLYHLAEELVTDTITSTAVISAALDVMGSITNSVVAHHARSDWYLPSWGIRWDLDQTHGLAIYFPTVEDGESVEYVGSLDWRLTAETQWDVFIHAYLNPATRAVASATDSSAPPPPPMPVPYQTMPGTLVAAFEEHAVTSLVIDGEETWLGTWGDGLVHHTAGETTTHLPPFDSRVEDMALAPDGSVWVATPNGVGRFDGTGWHHWLPGQFVDGVTVGDDGAVWCATADDLARFDGGTWTAYTAADGLPADRFRAVSVDEAGAVWGVTTGGAFGRFDGSTWVPIPGLPDGAVDALAHVDAVLYLGTGAGLVAYEHGAFAAIGPAEVPIGDLAVDGEGNLRAMVEDAQGVGVYDVEHGQWLIPPPYRDNQMSEVISADGTVRLRGAVRHVALAVEELETTDGTLPGQPPEVTMVRHVEVDLTDLHGVPLTTTRGLSVELSFALPASIRWETAQVGAFDAGSGTWEALPARSLDGEWITVATDHLSRLALFADADPHVRATFPAEGAAGVPRGAPLVITFTEPISPASLEFTVVPDPGGWDAIWRPGDIGVTLRHAPFGRGIEAVISVIAAQDQTGNGLADAPFTWRFTTATCEVYLPLIVRR